jgi:NADPH:quinone reductase-like Zn-dependent oxidoreductase
MHVLTAMIPPGLVAELLVVGGAGGVGVIAYGILAQALKIKEIHLLRSAVDDGLNRLTGPIR